MFKLEKSKHYIQCNEHLDRSYILKEKVDGRWFSSINKVVKDFLRHAIIKNKLQIGQEVTI